MVDLEGEQGGVEGKGDQFAEDGDGGELVGGEVLFKDSWVRGERQGHRRKMRKEREKVLLSKGGLGI